MPRSNQSSFQGRFRPLLPINFTNSDSTTPADPDLSSNLVHQGSIILGPRNPRSKTTCTVCILRRVKCDEGKPSCTRCLRVKRKCSYGKSLFRDRTHKIKELLRNEVVLSGSPIWRDCQSLPPLSVRLRLTRPATLINSAGDDFVHVCSSVRRRATSTSRRSQREQPGSAAPSSSGLASARYEDDSLANNSDASSLSPLPVTRRRNYCLISESDRCSCHVVSNVRAHVPWSTRMDTLTCS